MEEGRIERWNARERESESEQASDGASGKGGEMGAREIRRKREGRRTTESPAPKNRLLRTRADEPRGLAQRKPEWRHG
eukprot:709701-Pleurochrysis_carterae.AAC.2